jgi:hypothetical protein
MTSLTLKDFIDKEHMKNYFKHKRRAESYKREGSFGYDDKAKVVKTLKWLAVVVVIGVVIIYLSV